jgi:phospholipase/carboxylesterase
MIDSSATIQIGLRSLLRGDEPDRVRNMDIPLQQCDDHVIEPKKPAIATVIWLHGLGASAHDFDVIIPYLQTKPNFDQVRFIFPQAPMRAVTLNQGYVMPAWYDIYQIDKHGPEDQEGIQASFDSIKQKIDLQISLGMPAERIFLVGFSQGGAMVLYTSLMAKQTFAGIIGLSTYLPLSRHLEKAQVNSANHYWLAHGLQDAVVPFIYNEESVAKLRSFDCEVDCQTYPIGHEISMPEIDAMSGWMSAKLLKWCAS